MAYDKNTDYQAKINDAVKNKDYSSAAKYEQQRNEKISQTGDTKHQQTNNYSKYLNGGGSSVSSSSGSSGSSGGSFGGSGGSSGSGGSFGSSGSNGYLGGNPYENVDLGNTYDEMKPYATWQELQKVADERRYKAQSTPGLEKYVDDQKQLAMQAYINALKENEQRGQAAYIDSYQDVYDRASDARNAAIQSGIASLQQQIPGINQNYDELARQAYIQKMMAEKSLPSQLDAVGITGQGASESAIAQQNNAYLQTLSNSELARQNALRANQDAQTNVRNTANMQYAQDATNIAMQQAQAAQAYMELQRRQQQDLVANALSAAGLTGYYGSKPTLGYQQLMSDNQYRDAQLNQSQQGIDLDRQQAANSNKAAIQEFYFMLYDRTGDYKYLELAKQLL